MGDRKFGLLYFLASSKAFVVVKYLVSVLGISHAGKLPERR